MVSESSSRSKYYQRQMILPEVGAVGQEKLDRAKIVVVGAGGLGCPALTYLVRAGVGNITIVDSDIVDETNLHRQTLFGVESLGLLKSEAAALILKSSNPHINVVPINERINRHNVCDLLGDSDIVIDGTDNFSTKYLLNDACVKLGKVLVSGSILAFEGYLSVFNAKLTDGNRGPSYRCIFPEPPPPDSVPSCVEAGVLGVLPGVIGTLMAMEALKLVLNLGEILIGRLLVYDALSASFSQISFIRREDCEKYCALRDENYYNGLQRRCSMEVKTISAENLKSRLAKGENLVLIDVREPSEKAEFDIGGELIPSGTALQNAHKIPKDCEVIVYCRVGGRSHYVIDQLQKERGFTNLVNLEGGIMAWINS